MHLAKPLLFASQLGLEKGYDMITWAGGRGEWGGGTIFLLEKSAFLRVF